MKFYREEFPYSTVLPKMHIMEEHVVTWVKRWRLGSGLMGEQGAESIHAHLMKLDRIHQGIPNPVDRLKYLFKEHILECAPSLAFVLKEQKDHVGVLTAATAVILTVNVYT